MKKQNQSQMQEMGVGSQKTEVRSQESEVGGQKPEVKGQIQGIKAEMELKAEVRPLVLLLNDGMRIAIRQVASYKADQGNVLITLADGRNMIHHPRFVETCEEVIQRLDGIFGVESLSKAPSSKLQISGSGKETAGN